ncbi:atypical/ABC1/ABC1-B protein kinase [Lentinus tigrinus ALCF2SS1-7]|uniref:Atypical/ABC1/ABC1-B protein kinase n=1 Tax=Lentinus tigrinus ALCF2SS1-6 TaxID=1328759 RepID=A0A5C2RR88_9APHY|nr:atypical/ABC1/ABC1-B protein kinase [Lentinus tigrinus ALCF2SS1-6]RPD68654.1 atypical/ABC1/ABC1-B protein kinase [Lentinus tigrinus ALCF2SS1-7]
MLARLRLSPRPVFTSSFSASNTRTFASEASAAAPASTVSKSQKYIRRTLFTLFGVGVAYVVDRELHASAINRNVRTAWTCAVIALDYKLNFRPEKADSIPALQERVAQRVYDLLTSNGGLYIKIGQAFANNAALLPRPMQEKFAKLFDDAPQVPYSTIEHVFRSEFGRPPAGPDGVFDVFEEQAAASASVAQVHRAKLKTTDGSEQWVAVKIQKPDVSKQVEWDLGAFRVVMWIYEHWLFHLPVCFAVDFINDHLRRELDFEAEARHALRTAEFVSKEPRLSDRVYIPKVYPELSTKKVMVAEWIDGVRLSDRRGIQRLMGDDSSASSSPPPLPADRFPTLKGGAQWVMQTMVDLFSAQIFDWGWVHCDPHPGNIIIRPHPDPARARQRQAQFVLLDHGLYVQLSASFQQQYAQLWKGLLSADFNVVKSVAEEWGIGTPDLFASATLMRPVRFKETDTPDFDKMDDYERGVYMKEKLKGFLQDTDRMPKELIFIGRNMRIVQGNNQLFASPVNRIRITAYWASRSLVTSHQLSLVQRIRELFNHLIFLSVMFSIDVLFWATKVRQWVARRLGRKGESFEDELERTMRNFAKSNFGLDVQQGAFEG